MQITLSFNGTAFTADLNRPLPIGLPLLAGFESVNCFYAPPVEYSPVRSGDFVGSTQEGGVVNFFNVRLNPHGNGTHTECVGHIAKERYVIRECLMEYHFPALLVSVFPEKWDNGDRVITLNCLKDLLEPGIAKALVVRSLPNDDLKRRTNYSGANPVYFAADAIQFIVDCGIEHLLTDLPSVDREEDGGQLAAHKTFWNYPGDAVREHYTITELVYVPNEIKDGLYLLNLQIAAFDLDASPSMPVLYRMDKI